MMNTNEESKICSEHVGFPPASDAIMKMRVTSAQFSCLWQNIIDKMQGGMVPFLTVLEILCEGRLKQVCCRCYKEVVVSEVVLSQVLSPLYPDKIEVPTLAFGTIRAILCGSQGCGQLWNKIHCADVILLLDYTKRAIQFVCNRCDFCVKYYSGTKMGKGCSRCLNKIYCVEECRDVDWELHKLV